MTQDIEKFRAGFEAHAAGRGLTLTRGKVGDGYYLADTNEAWRAWTASKLEASTEPSSTSTSQGAPIGEVVGIRDHDGQAVVGLYDDTIKVGDLVYVSGNPGAAPGDALDAAPRPIPFCVMLHSDGTMTDLTKMLKCACQACNPHLVGRMMFICPKCGDKRCPHAGNHFFKCAAIATSTSKGE